jgi:guanylate kinase
VGSEGVLLVVTGTGGAGKGTIVEELRRRYPDLWWSVSWATRPPRPGEVDGEHYWFVPRARFEEVRAAGGFLESFEVYGELKGTPKQPIIDALEAGRDVLLEVDIQGALAVREAFPHAEVVFIAAPDLTVQEQRLRARAADSDAEIALRLESAAAELGLAHDAGLRIVVNDDVARAVGELAAILSARRHGG